MSLGLPSSTFGTGGGAKRLGVASRSHRVSTSIAEGAIFIPKPHKRVDFKLQSDFHVMGSKPGGAPLPGSGKSEYAPLPGSKVAGGKGENISQGNFGVNGLTARFSSAAYSGQMVGGSVSMEVVSDPNKQTEVIATQEEGRQVNHKEVHFSQQYDSYGRPRIGFSREPYDFAATKYVSVTNQVAFQANMAKVHDEYDKFLLTGTAVTPEQKPEEVPVFGETSDPVDETKSADVDMLGPEGSGNTGPDKKSVKESFDDQQVKMVDTFTKGAAAGVSGSSSSDKVGFDSTKTKQSVDLTA